MRTYPHSDRAPLALRLQQEHAADMWTIQRQAEARASARLRAITDYDERLAVKTGEAHENLGS